MKKVLLTLSVLIGFFQMEAKKVKFSVDMSSVDDIHATGPHITGDFQAAAGLATDSFSTYTPLLKEVGKDNIYSIVVDLPAFKKYEFAFLNGDLGYMQEFIQSESQSPTGNRWIYVDSLGSDTTDLGAVLFGRTSPDETHRWGNAPKGKVFVKVSTNASQLTVHKSGMYAAFTTDGVAFAKSPLYSFNGDGIYEGYVFADSAKAYQYRFFNGYDLNGAETIAGSCANVLGNRSVDAIEDKVMDVVCFGSCTSECPSVSTSKEESYLYAQKMNLYPNPSLTGNVTIEIDSNISEEYQVKIMDHTGRLVRQYSNENKVDLVLANGIFIVKMEGKNGTLGVKKLIVNP